MAKHRGTPYTGGTKTTCNRGLFNARLRQTLRLRPQVDVTFSFLFDHLIALALADLKHGHCQSAGSRLSKARRLASRQGAWLDNLLERQRWLTEVYSYGNHTPRQQRALERAMVAMDDLLESGR